MKLKNMTALYCSSPEWYELSESSRRVYQRGIRLSARFMEMDVDAITRPMIIKLKDDLFHKRASCRIALITLNNIMRFGYDRGLCKFNHAAYMRNLPKKKAMPRWTDDECELFRKEAPDYIRGAFLLALYTGQRRSDLIRMKWDQYDGTYIRVLQQKTKRPLRIPVHPHLKKELDEMKKVSGTITMGKRSNVPSPYILHNCHGHPWSLLALTTAVTRVCKSLGIENRSLHGLRKTTAAKLAEAGCAPNMIGAITGHVTLKELENYTREAEQEKMADMAMLRWGSTAGAIPAE